MDELFKSLLGDIPEQRQPEDEHVPRIEVRKVSAYMPISADYLRMIEEDAREMAEARARWDAMTPEEQAQATAEWEAQQAAEKLARTCEHCGCDPDEHGGY